MRELELINLEKSRLSEHLINVYKYLKGECRVDRVRLFPVLTSDMTKVSRHTPKYVGSLLNIGKYSFMAKHWHRLPRDAVKCPSLEILKGHTDMVLGNLF